MKEAKEIVSGKKVLYYSLMLLALFAVMAVTAVESYPASADAAGFRGMKRSPEQVVAKLKERLNLTADQVRALEPIIRDNMAKRMELMKEMRKLQKSGDAKIIAILTKEQAVEFQKIRDRMRARGRRPQSPGNR